MILSDVSIRERIQAGDIQLESNADYDIFEQIGPASLDFRLGNIFKVYKR